MLKVRIIYTILLTCTLVIAKDDYNEPIVSVKNGQLQGGITKSRDGRQFFQFLGIQYGKLTKRFQTSAPVYSWIGIKDVRNPGPICYQKTFHTLDVVGEEDCLNLNIYSPSLPSESNTKLNVMAFIHGGAFFSGSGIMYGPNYLMDEDIVLVTINYRLGAFGFLDLGIKEAPGNQGAKDVVLALKWIQDNIASFNGNPNQVTVFGESAGAAIVSNLIYSPMSQGLFINAITQSGTGIAPFSINLNAKHYALFIASKVNCTDHNTSVNLNDENKKESYKQIMTCLQKSNKLDILNTISPLEPDWSFWEDEVKDAEFPFNFSVEDEIEGEEAFLPDIPHNLIKSGKFIKVPILNGVNQLEWHPVSFGIIGDKKKVHLLNTEWNRYAPILYAYYNFGKRIIDQQQQQQQQKPIIMNLTRDELSEQLKTFYFQMNPILQNDSKSFETLSFSLADRVMNYKARNLNSLLTEQSVNTYLYMFDKKMTGSEFGPFHAEELNYLFPIPPPDGKPPIGLNSPDYKFSKNMIKLWINFARTGTPSYKWGENTEEWTPFENTSSNIKWFHIGDNGIKGHFENDEFRSRMEFWKYVDKYETEEINAVVKNRIGRRNDNKTEL